MSLPLPQKKKNFNNKSSDERRLIERFQNSEKFYIQLLKTAVTTYLTDLPDDLRTTLDTFLKAFRRITKFHTETFHPKLIQCEMKTITICDLIKTHLDNSDFNIYFKYAAYVHEALQMIRYFHLNSVRIFHQNKLCCIVVNVFGILFFVIILLVAGHFHFILGFTFAFYFFVFGIYWLL